MTAIGRCRALLRFACASVALSCSGGLASSSTDGLPELVPERAGAGTSSAAVWKEAMDSLGEQLVKNLRGVPVQNAIKLAIFDVTSPQGGLCALGLTIEEELTTRLFRSKRFDIVERRQLSTVMAEQRMSTSESLDPRQAAKLGRLLGAQAVLAGTAVNVSEGFRVLPKIVLVETAQIISVAEANVPAIVAEKYGGCERVPRTDGWRSATETRDNGFTEDFRRTGIGGVPDGWLGAEHYGVKEDVRGRRYFTCRDSGPARFTIPVRDVPDDYRVEVAFSWIGGKYGAVALQFGPVRASLGPDGEVTLNQLQQRISPAPPLDSPVTLSLEKRRSVFRVLIDGREVMFARYLNLAPVDLLILDLYAGGVVSCPDAPVIVHHVHVGRAGGS